MKINKKGFTLIELMVVMTIIAVLSVLIIGAIQAARKASFESQNRGNARTIEVALESYAAKHNGQYPSITDGSFTSVATGTGILSGYITDWKGGACSSGGGIVNSSSNTFTLTIHASDCSSTLDTITH